MCAALKGVRGNEGRLKRCKSATCVIATNIRLTKERSAQREVKKDSVGGGMWEREGGGENKK